MPSAIVRTTWTVFVAGGRRRGWSARPLARQLQPAKREVVGHVRHRRTAKARGDVVPAEPPARAVLLGVEPIAGVVGQIDAADERELAVDHDRLLVVTVERMLARVGLAPDPRPADEGLHRLADLRAGGMEGGHGRAGPDQDPHIDPSRRARPAARRGRSARARARPRRPAATCQPVMWTCRRRRASRSPSRAARPRRRSGPRARSPVAAACAPAPTDPAQLGRRT